MDFSNGHPGMDNLDTLPMDLGHVALVQQQEEVQDARPPSETKETPSILNKRTLELGEESSGEEVDEKVRVTKWIL